MRIGRNAGRRITPPATIIGRAAPPVLFPGVARLEFRPRNDLAGGPALRLFAGVVERRDRAALCRPGARPGPPEPRRRGLHRPHRRPAHPAWLVLRYYRS